jgi:hypothetical protein
MCRLHQSISVFFNSQFLIFLQTFADANALRDASHFLSIFATYDLSIYSPSPPMGYLSILMLACLWR